MTTERTIPEQVASRLLGERACAKCGEPLLWNPRAYSNPNDDMTMCNHCFYGWLPLR